MRKYLSIGALLLACALWLNAQEKQKSGNEKTKPDFSGNWLLNRDRSNSRPAQKADLPLKITHRDPEITFTHQYEDGGKIVGRDFVYYTDGRGETNQATRILTTSPSVISRDLDKQVIQSKSRWSGHKLVTRLTINSVIAAHMLQFDVIEEWKLSDDGRTLTQTTRIVYRPDFGDASFIPANASPQKKVYSRIPN